MNEIQILNKHHLGKDFAWPTVRQVYIGRGSPLGNPFKIENGRTRDQAVDQYETYLYDKLQGNNHITSELTRIAGMVTDGTGQPVQLVCFCAPARCHGDIIKQVLLQALEQAA